jgi:MoaA/NifB/PqqE/SkfB family radical SAM enzyme
MNFKNGWQARVDEEGRMILSPEFVTHFGLKPGVGVRIEEGGYGLKLIRPVTHLAKVYIEPTNACNLECRTCIRNVWDEPIGQMSGKTFDRIIEGLESFSPKPTVFFGGFGEPLSHPGIVDMVARVKALGGTIEVITNGTLLTQEMSGRLIEAGLDMLWVSLDGATPESYADVRLGAALPEVLANLTNFRRARWGDYPPSFGFDYHLKPQTGIVFVAMKRNVADLPSVIQLGNQLGVGRFLVTNVLPYTAELCDEILYSRALTDSIYLPSRWGSRMKLPKIDISEATQESLFQVMRGGHSIIFAGASLGESNDRCPFIEGGSMAIGWDGNLSPCLPLLHNHVTYLNGWERSLKRHTVGNVMERDLNDLWNAPEYTAFRERVQKFDFSYCIFCGGCNLIESNDEDCFGNTFPVCGGCLWAQGVIQCP